MARIVEEKEDLDWREITPEEAREMFDLSARYWMKMSGEEFLRRWDAAEFGDPDNPYRSELVHVVMMLPFAR